MRASVPRKTQERNSPRGAVQSRSGLSEQFKSYLAHHRSSCTESLFRLLNTPVQTLMTATVVAIALALPLTLLIAMANIEELGASWDANPKISVYLNSRAKKAAIDQLVAKIESNSDVDNVEYLSPVEALADFQKFSGFGSALEALNQNPLPPTLIISPKAGAMAPERLAKLGDWVHEEAIVDDLSLDMDWVRRLQEIMLLGQKIISALALLLGFGVLLAIGNTIRLAIENRRDEILVSKLVGGTDGFVRRPFLYAGGWYGFFGGVLAASIVAVAYASLAPSIERLTHLYQSEFDFKGLDAVLVIQLLVLSCLLGWLGSWVAVSRHITQIEPK